MRKERKPRQVRVEQQQLFECIDEIKAEAVELNRKLLKVIDCEEQRRIEEERWLYVLSIYERLAVNGELSSMKQEDKPLRIVKG